MNERDKQQQTATKCERIPSTKQKANASCIFGSSNNNNNKK